MEGKKNRNAGLRGVSAAMRVAALAVVAMVAVVALASCAPGVAGSGAQSGSAQGIAAYYGGGEWQEHVVYEDEITDYTADFREEHGYEDDVWWGRYLVDYDMTPASWREDVIRQKVDRVLVTEKAESLGITADEDAIAERIAAAKEQAGIDADDEQAWAEYLAENGQTPDELEDAYRFSSIEQQLFSSEIDVDSDMRNEMGDDYIRSNLADQVVRHYYVIEFDPANEAGAEACVRELTSIGAEEASARFEELADTLTNGDSYPFDQDASFADLGWDFLVDMDTVDPDMLLRRAKLDAGELYAEPLKGEDAYRVVYCAEREQFDGEISYERIGSDSLKDIIANLALTAHWTGLMQQYLSDLEQSAAIQVTPMPDGLPYDVDIEETGE